MPKDISSPFTPGRPVPVEFFVGRLEEIGRLRKKVESAVGARRLEMGFVVGERGIGKSSLAAFVRTLCEREQRVLGIHTFLGGVSTLEEMVRRVFDRLLKEGVETPWYGKLKAFFGKHIREVGLFGISVEFGAPDKDLGRLVHDFAPALRNLLENLKDEKSGVLVILDDINGLALSEHFANWLKSLVDEISVSKQPLPLCLLLVGLEDRRESLIQLQPSLARVFDIVDIRSWSGQETQEFFRTAFAKVGMPVKDDALEMLAHYAGGLPVFAHELGDAAFAIDTDNVIDFGDAANAVVNAADVIGRKHLEPRVLSSIRSTHYRSILRKIAREPFHAAFARAEVARGLRAEEVKVLGNFLRKMEDLGVIEKDREKGPGSYRFCSRLHFLYFMMEARRAAERSQ